MTTTNRQWSRYARDNLEGNVCPLEQMVLGHSQELELVEAHVGGLDQNSGVSRF